MKKIIIVSNRLPVTVSGDSIKKSSGGLVSALDGAFDQNDMLWIGWPGTYESKSIIPSKLTKSLAKDYRCYPVFLSRKEVADFYQGFSNSCLWPMLHYFPQYVRYSAESWEAYVKINQRFAETIAEQASDTDLIWIHDYHLFLVPEMLRKLNPKLSIGFFLHTPFPSFEIFRCSPHRKEILNGLLGADLIGFHTYGYLRHFRSSLIRLLNTEINVGTVLCGERFSKLGVYPIGINTNQFLKELRSEKFKKRRAFLKTMHNPYKVILSVERVDYTKGILRRLEAIEKFLSIKKNKSNAIFIFIGIPTRGEVKEYKELLIQIQKKVGELNSQYSDIGYTPINFIHKTIPFTDLCALYSIADVAMLTPLIDGMNLVSKEYLICQVDSHGVLLLSEFAGAAHELYNSVLVNPYDIDNIAESLETALSMSEVEKTERLKSMRDHVIKYDATHWARTFLEDLVQKNKSQKEQKTNYKDLFSKSTFLKIKKSKKTALFIDYDGTLREFEELPHMAHPPASTLEIIKSLALNQKYEVFIISGRKGEDLEKWFKGVPVTLISEHGFNILYPNATEWKHLYSNIHFTWKNKVKKIFTQYVATTPGAFIEEKKSAMVWHFRRADPEFGEWKAQQLMSNLIEMMTNESVVVNHGKLIVEVSSSQINKGAAVRYFMKENKYDLILCAGDDKTDETMFKIQHSKVMTVKIGKGETYAKYKVLSPLVFREFLKKLVKLKKV